MAPLRLALLLIAVGAWTLLLAPDAHAGVHSNTSAITIPAEGAATPYPSNISVSGEGAFVTKVTVTLNGFSHIFPDDVDVMVRSPSGGAVVLMSDVGDGGTVSGLGLTFDDAAASTLPDETTLAAGTYQPSNFGTAAPLCSEDPGADTWPFPVSGATLATFINTAANGTWSLYVLDDCTGDDGSISNGWSLNITSSATPTPVLVRSFGAQAQRRAVTLTWRTAAGAELLGFHVYRSGGGGTARVNRRMIAVKSRGSTSGASYRFVDRSVRPGTRYTYRLQYVKLDGTRAWARTVSVKTRR